ncbi:MAG TPA: zinc ABC transporter substrate-binding protein [Candidatus Angelobacter sp.]|nr:zinc ABC transporter substrate-binding protein [Candidatus Angelobacter sp.]
MRRELKIVLTVGIITVAVGGAYVASRYLHTSSSSLSCLSGALPYSPTHVLINQHGTNQQPIQSSTSTTIQIVAGENFWGSLVSQLGGNHTSVTSIVTDPNADPHEYESNSADAQAVANANLVIVNGAGYDDWALHLIAAGNNQNQKILNVADLLGKKAGDNPHFWYSPTYVNETIHQMFLDTLSIDQANSAYYAQQYANLNASLGQYNRRIMEISQKFAGTRAASTESIFEYLANATHLNLISPPAFMKAVAEGNDPSPGCIALFESQLLNPASPGNATVLVYNAQTSSPLTLQIRTEAASHNIPIVPVTETIQPPDAPFQDWMNGQLLQLQNALNPTLGQ